MRQSNIIQASYNFLKDNKNYNKLLQKIRLYQAIKER